MLQLVRALGVVASAALLYASHLVPAMAPFAFVALVPFLLAIRGLGLGCAAALGLALGTVFGVAAGGWIPRAFAHFGSTGVAPFLGLLLAVVAVLGLPYAALGSSVGLLRNARSSTRIVAIGLSCLAIDTARSHGLLGWPWLLLGHSQAHAHGVAQLAVLGGVPLISALVAAVNAALAESVESLVRHRSSASPLAVPLLSAAGAAMAFGLPVAQYFHSDGEPSDPYKLLVVQPNIPVEERWVNEVQRTHLAIAVQLTEQGLAGAQSIPDLIIWPETFVTARIDEDEAVRADLLRHVAAFPAPLIVGAVRNASSGADNRYRGSALWIHPRDGISASVDKTRGVPLVESDGAVSGADLFRTLTGQRGSTLRLEEAPSAGPLRVGDDSFAVLFCFEATYPGLAAERRDPGSRALLNLANDSWIADPSISRQQLAFASFRAIEQRLPLVRVAHGGVSASIDPFGRIVQEIPFDTEGTAVVILHRSGAPTGAERAGFAALLISGGIVGALLDHVLRRWWT